MALKQITYRVIILCEDQELSNEFINSNSDVFDYNDGATVRDKLSKVSEKAIKAAWVEYKKINNPKS